MSDADAPGEERRRSRANRRARVEALTDSLRDPVTGLPNEDGIKQVLESARRRAERHGTVFAAIRCVVAGGDGSHTGLLGELTGRVRDLLRQADTVGSDGAAIIVVAEDLHDEQDAAGITYRLLSSAVAPIDGGDAPAEVGLVAGTVVADGSTAPGSLLEAAAAAAGEALARGGFELVDLRQR
ncbi:MAG: hypothetical protein R2716_10130 [Microthrixaceae bacterium]